MCREEARPSDDCIAFITSAANFTASTRQCLFPLSRLSNHLLFDKLLLNRHVLAELNPVKPLICKKSEKPIITFRESNKASTPFQLAVRKISLFPLGLIPDRFAKTLPWHIYRRKCIPYKSLIDIEAEFSRIFDTGEANMKLRVQAKFALVVVVFGVLAACESEYDPTVTDANQPITETPEETTNGDYAAENFGRNSENTATDNGSGEDRNSAANTNELTDSSEQDNTSQTTRDQTTRDQTTREEYGITDERDGTPDTGSWDESVESENAQASTTQPEDTEAGANQEESLSGTYGDVHSDVAAMEQQAVQFEFDSSDLTSEAESKLDDFIASMEEVDPQEVELLIKGYTDSQGSEEYNQALATRRAEAVKEYLLEQGLPSDNLKIEAVGETSSDSVASTSADGSRRVMVEMVVPYAEELTAN